MTEQQRFLNIIAVLVQKLGGEVVITEAELRNPPAGNMNVTPENTITIKVDM